jgi:protein-disulfide isomerase
MLRLYIFLIAVFLAACSEEKIPNPAEKQISEYTSNIKECKQKSSDKVSKEAIAPEKNSNNIAENKVQLVSSETEATPVKSFPQALISLDIHHSDMVYGNPNSKVILIEYFAPTCPHCVFYHKEVFPKIKEKYIDTNKIGYVVRIFIGNKQDFDAALLIRCTSNKEDYLKFVNVILQQQNSWISSQKYRDILTNIGQLGGIPPEKYAKCLNDEKLNEILINGTKVIAQSPRFIGTPAFFINQNQFTDPYSFDNLSRAIDKAL